MLPPVAIRSFVLVAALAIGCGSSGASHPGGAAGGATGVGRGTGGGDEAGAGGSAGGGAGDVGGAGGAGDLGGAGGDITQPPPDGGAESCFGPCLDPLLAQCSRVGQSCVQAMSGSNGVTCYANGVRILANATSTMASRKRANGDLCLTITAVSGQYQDFMDAQGNPVAHLQFTASTTQYLLTCASTGITTIVDLMSPQCAAYAASAQQCTQGSCTW